MKNLGRVLGLLILFSASAFCASPDAQLPTITGATLDNQKVVLPDPGRYKALVLVFGFSHKSADQTEAWTKRIAQDYNSHPEVGYFEIPELQGVPGMVKPMILHGMRREVAQPEHSHFVPIYQHEQELKKIVGFSSDEDAYVMVTTTDGRIIWQAHGAINDQAYSGLVQALSSILPKQ